MSKVMYIIFLFVSLALFFYIIYWDSPDKIESQVPTVIEDKIKTIKVQEVDTFEQKSVVGFSILDHFDYLFKLRQELFLHWGFFITVTMALYGFIFMRDKNSADLPDHLIAILYTIFTVIIVFSFFKILKASNMCVKDIKFLYASEIKRYPADGFMRSSIDYNYFRTFWGCVVEIIFFLIPTYLIIYWSKIRALIKKKRKKRTGPSKGPVN